MDFPRAVDAIAGFLRRENAPFALAGAFALQAYGLARATVDIDFVTDVGVQKKLIAHLESLGYETLYASPGYSNHLHPDPRLGRVDFIYVEGETSRRLFDGAVSTLVVGGQSLPVPRAEHLAAMKVHAMKNDPGRSAQEMADIRFLWKLRGVDQGEIRAYFEKAGLAEKLDEL